MKVGLLGGSFNPAHEGHVHISSLAYKRLGLDAVWWVVAPKNPDKSFGDIASFEARISQAERVAVSYPFISVFSGEKNIKGAHAKTQTFLLMRRLLKEYSHDFIWIAGEDSFKGMHRWCMVEEILAHVPLAVFARGECRGTPFCPIAERFKRYRHSEREARHLGRCEAPAWIFFKTPLNDASSTKIRKKVTGYKDKGEGKI